VWGPAAESNRRPSYYERGLGSLSQSHFPQRPAIPWVGTSTDEGTHLVHVHQAALCLIGTLLFWRIWRHNGCMTSVQIKDVPEQTHAVLRERAARNHQSLQEYLRSWLIEQASRPTLEEVLARAGGRSGGSIPTDAAVKTLRGDRAGH